MTSKKIKSSVAIIISALFLTACSNQTVKDKTVGSGSGNKSVVTSNNGTNNGAKNGVSNQTSRATNGTLGADGNSRIDSSEQNGNGSSQFNYLPDTVNNDPNNTEDISIAGLSNPDNLLSQRIIYFDYDKAAIRPEFLVLISTHAKLLAKYPNLKMRLEGHADERGSRQYNVALSASRSQSVKNIMLAQGPSSSQIKTIGFGEEVPLVKGQNAKSWEKNRRVEIKYDDY